MAHIMAERDFGFATGGDPHLERRRKLGSGGRKPLPLLSIVKPWESWEINVRTNILLPFELWRQRTL